MYNYMERQKQESSMMRSKYADQAPYPTAGRYIDFMFMRKEWQLNMAVLTYLEAITVGDEG